MVSGRNRAGSVSSASMKTPSAVILPSACRSAEHETAMATGSEAPCRGSRTTRTSWQKYLPPNWAPMPKSRVSSSTCSSSSVSRNPCAAIDPSRGRSSRYLADAYFAVLRANSALVPPMTMARWYGRTGGGAEAAQLLVEEREHPLGVQDRLGLLVEEGLVGAAAALGHEQELVGGLVPPRGVGVELDLGGQVGPGVLLLPGGQRRHLGVAQVEPRVGVVDALGDGPLVGAGRQHVLAPLAHDDGGAGVLAHRQHPAGRDVGVLEQVQGHELVVVAGLGVVDDAPQLGQVRRSQVVGDVVHRGLGQRPQRVRARPGGRSGRPGPRPSRRPRW